MTDEPPGVAEITDKAFIAINYGSYVSLTKRKNVSLTKKFLRREKVDLKVAKVGFLSFLFNLFTRYTRSRGVLQWDGNEPNARPLKGKTFAFSL